MSPRKAASGERKKQALDAIKEFEKKKQNWGPADLARALDCTPAHAWQLVQSLTYTGELKRGARTVVIPEALVTA